MIRKLVLVLLLFILGAILAYQELERRWQQPLRVPGEGAVIDVGPGDSLRAVARRLHREGLVPYPNMLIVYARMTGADLQIKPGEYRLPPAITAQGLLDLLVSGKVIQYKVTFPEGISLQQALALLASQDQLVLSLEDGDDPRLQELVEPYTHPEGLFFPDTYLFPRDTTDLQLLQRAHEKMVAVLEQEWLEREADLPYKTPYEALIMASIIERETSLPEEREQIAGVFVRRLQAGMRLQTDPTVIYGAGEEFDGNLRREHLEDDSNAYNTYRRDGLPPTPIALPGQASIRAALHPAPGRELYFVARGDGGHQFSATLAQHEAAVRKYQLERRTDYRSTPRQP